LDELEALINKNDDTTEKAGNGEIQEGVLEARLRLQTTVETVRELEARQTESS